MNNLPISIKENPQSRYGVLTEYLEQDAAYWKENDLWDIKDSIFIGKSIYGTRHIDFSEFTNEQIKNEVKYFVISSFKEERISLSTLANLSQRMLKLGGFISRDYKKAVSLGELGDKEKFVTKLIFYLRGSGIKEKQTIEIYRSTVFCIIEFITDFYDEREETQKDIWELKRIPGARVSVTQQNKGNRLDFGRFPEFYRELLKRYFRTFITKRSSSHCTNVFHAIEMFLRVFYEMGYADGFLKALTRSDIEKYLYEISNRFKDRNVTYYNKFISYPRTFLEYIQMAEYKEAPQKEAAFLIFEDDLPKRERDKDRLRRIKFIPEPVMEQLDNSIMELDRPECIPLYTLLRETGWRGADILNLRYDSCLEKIWDAKEKGYTDWLCGEITKTGIAVLKVPLREAVGRMLEALIEECRMKSTPQNNPEKYLFVNHTGRRKGEVLTKAFLLGSVKRLIKEKDIRGGDGERYRFKMHGLRHTRAKEYVEQGIGISIIQELLGHQSLQMTIHYAMVSENLIYEKWKQTESLNIFKLSNKKQEDSKKESPLEDVEKIHYEHIKRSLDAVRVPFGVCFKATKLSCRQQTSHCLQCGGFCSTSENLSEYEEEISRVKEQIEVSRIHNREDWVKKNQEYLQALEKTKKEIETNGIVHKNGSSREESR